MEKSKTSLDHVRIAAHCATDWNQMPSFQGDRVRFCSRCNLNVYNLSGITQDEATALVYQTEWRLCVSFYRRADGTVLTENCPVGLRAIKRRKARLAQVLLGMLVITLSAIGLSSLSNSEPSPQGASPTGEQIWKNEAVDEAAEIEDPVLRVNREAKNGRYNDPASTRDLTTLPEGSVTFTIACGMYDTTIFLTGSHDVIVLGSTISAQPYLSADRGTIYTEYSLEVEEVLKPSSAKLPLVQGQLIVDRTGGVLRRRNGQVIAAQFQATRLARPLDVGRRYLLLCRLIDDGKDLILGEAFELLDGKVYALGEQRGRDRLVGELPGAEPFLSEEKGFLAAVRDATKHPFDAHYFSAPR
jgi:hypothetical protein